MKPRLLVADDQRSVRESLSKLLQAEQYDVVLAVDGNEAVEKFLDDPARFDVVLTDLHMPVRNGWASLDRLLEINPRLPVILLTGMPNQRELAETSKASALIEKPIDVAALLRLLRELVAGNALPGLQSPPRRTLAFRYVPAERAPRREEQSNPYSHWGLNE